MIKKMSDKFSGGVIGLFILFVLAGFVYLAIQNNRLRNQIQAVREGVPNLLINDHAPSIEIIKINGEKDFIEFSHKDQKHLLFILANSCNPCEKNMHFWKRLYFQLKDHVQVLGIVLEGMNQAQSLMKDLKVGFPVYGLDENSRFKKSYRVSNLSQTLVIDEQGRVEWIKTGDLNGDDYQKIKKLALR